LNWDLVSGAEDFDHFILSYTDNGSPRQTISASLPAAQRQSWFWGTPGHTYQFCVQGVDRNGNVAACPTSPLAVTTVSATCTNDSYETDNASAQAVTLPLATAQAHTLCASDADWVKVSLPANKTFIIKVLPLSGYAAVKLSAFGPNDAAHALGVVVPDPDTSVTVWGVKPATAGIYYFKLEANDVRLFGSQVRYSIQVNEGIPVFMPLVP
jgi:hypothetical protein